MASGEKSSMPGLVVVGSYNTDLIIWCDRIPSKGETLMGGDSEMFCGGRGANCAVAAARAGCELGKQPISSKLSETSRSGNS